MAGGSFDAKAAFALLTPDEQRAIGEAGLLLAYAIDAKEWLDKEHDGAGDPQRPFEIAETEAYDLLLAAAYAAEIPGFRAEPPAPPDLTPFNIAQCRVCGCTDHHACPGGCSWVDDDLCSACVTETAHG